VSGIAGIGDTPVVQLERLVGGDVAEVWVKLEAANPTSSYKDRMALAMIEAAERDGRLQPGQPVVEYSGGSTGSSLAFVCAVKGYSLRVVSSDAFATEKIRTMQAFGADVELIPSPQGITPQLIPAMVRRAREIAEETGAFWTDQFNNADMPRRLSASWRRTARTAARSAGPNGVLQLRRYGRMLPWHLQRPHRQVSRASSRRRGTCGIGCAVRRRRRDAPHRGRWHWVLAAAPPAREFR
jgi:Pyridoxal-phosphate dependent enzyme